MTSMSSTCNINSPQLPAILLVESDPLIRGYFDRLFSLQYSVFKAENSLEALKFFCRTLPKLRSVCMATRSMNWKMTLFQ